MNWKTWLNGVIGGFIGAAASALTVSITDPEHFSPMAAGGIERLSVTIAASGLVGAALYLKQHPTPWDGIERRNGNDISPK